MDFIRVLFFGRENFKIDVESINELDTTVIMDFIRVLFFGREN